MGNFQNKELAGESQARLLGNPKAATLNEPCWCGVPILGVRTASWALWLLLIGRTRRAVGTINAKRWIIRKLGAVWLG